MVERGAGPGAIVEAVAERTGYRAALEAEDTLEAHSRMENIAELAGAAGEYDSLDEFLESVALVSDSDELDAADRRVSLMTLHTAKGLEFPAVFLVGLEDGVFPHLRALEDPLQLEEERRLCYVGITRARRQLYLTHAWSRTLWGSTSHAIPSRFLSELPGRAGARRGLVVDQAPRPAARAVVVAPARRRGRGPDADDWDGVDESPPPTPSTARTTPTTSGPTTSTTPIRGATPSPARRRARPRRRGAALPASAARRRAPPGRKSRLPKMAEWRNGTTPRVVSPRRPRRRPRRATRLGRGHLRPHRRPHDALGRGGPRPPGACEATRPSSTPGPAAAASPRCCSSGCPTGRVVALDAAPSMLAEARKRLARFGDRVRFVESDLLELSPARARERRPGRRRAVHGHLPLGARPRPPLRQPRRGDAPRGATLAAQCGAAGNIARPDRGGAGHGVRARRRVATTPHPRTPEPGCERAGFEDVEVWTHPEPTPSGRRARSSRPISRRCASAPTWRAWPPTERRPLPAPGGGGDARAGHRLRPPQHERPTALLTDGPAACSAREPAPQRGGQQSHDARTRTATGAGDHTTGVDRSMPATTSAATASGGGGERVRGRGPRSCGWPPNRGGRS